MIIQDKLVKELNDAKNAVEEYVYDLRDKLCGIYEKYITEGVSNTFCIYYTRPPCCSKQLLYLRRCMKN